MGTAIYLIVFVWWKKKSQPTFTDGPLIMQPDFSNNHYNETPVLFMCEKHHLTTVYVLMPLQQCTHKADFKSPARTAFLFGQIEWQTHTSSVKKIVPMIIFRLEIGFIEHKL